MKLTTLYAPDVLAARVRELAEAIRAAHPGGRLVVVVVLRGAFVFAADLVRALWPLDLVVDFVALASYEGTETTGRVRLVTDLREDVAGAHVLVVEDICDTGLTLSFLVGALRARGPASVRTCVMLDKPSRRKVDFRTDFTGFTIPDRFVVGYGLDLDGAYRNLPEIAEVHEVP
jgi:hypoxanthine phosphoribosyltransferase